MTTIVRCGLRLLAVLLCVAGAWEPAAAQQQGARLDSLSSRVRRLERDVNSLESELGSVRARVQSADDRVQELRREYDAAEYAPEGVLLFFIGAFCALWAQNTGRNAWLWFFVGALFHVVTLLVLLWKNAADRRPARRGHPPRAFGT